jgi:hypothetical protein
MTTSSYWVALIFIVGLVFIAGVFVGEAVTRACY